MRSIPIDLPHALQVFGSLLKDGTVILGIEHGGVPFELLDAVSLRIASTAECTAEVVQVRYISDTFQEIQLRGIGVVSRVNIS